MEVGVTGDPEKRTSPNPKIRTQQRGGNNVICKGRGRESEKQKTPRVIL